MSRHVLRVVTQIALGLILAFGAQSAIADMLTWSGTAGATWSTSSTWWNAATVATPWDLANGTGNIADFVAGGDTPAVGGTVYANGLQFDNTANISGGTISLVAGALTTPTITVNTTSGTIGAVLAGTAGLAKSGTGLLILTAANIYTGGTTVNGGTLQVGNGGSTGSIPTTSITVAPAATLAYNFSSAYTATPLSVSGNLSYKSAGQLSLSGTYGGYQIAAVGNNVNVTGNLFINAGAGGATITGSNSTTANTGGITSSAARNISTTGNVTFSGTQGNTSADGRADGIQLAGAFTSTAGTLTFDGTAAPGTGYGIECGVSGVWGGAISTFGNVVFKGTGGSGSNGYGHDSDLNLGNLTGNGTVTLIGRNRGLKASTTFAASGGLPYNVVIQTTAGVGIAGLLGSGTDTTGGGNYTVNAGGATTLTSRTVNAGSGTISLNSASTLTLTGGVVLSGSQVNLTSSGAMTLNGATLTGSQIAVGAGSYINVQGGPLAINSSGTGTTTITASGGGSGNGAIYWNNVNFNTTTTGNVTFSAPNSTDGNYKSAIALTGSFTSTAGTLTFDGVAAPSGGGYGVENGVSGSYGGSISTFGNVTFKGTGGGSRSSDMNIGNLTGNGTVTVVGRLKGLNYNGTFTATGGLPYNVVLQTTNSASINGQLASGTDITGGGSYTINSAGAVYFGGRTINAGSGAISLTSASGYYVTDNSTLQGATLAITDTQAITVSSGMVLTLNASGTIANPIIGASGKLTLAGGAITLTGSNTYTGATTVSAGTLAVNGSLAAGSNVAVATTATLAGSGLIGGNTTLTGNGVINLSGGTIGGSLGVTGGNWTGSGTVAGLITSSSNTFTVANGANLIASGGASLSGGVLNVASGGTLTANAGMTLSGGALTGVGTVSSGTVTVAAGGLIAPGPTAANNSIGTLTLANLAASGGGTLNYDLSNSTAGSNDLLQVNGALTLNGSTTINVYKTNGVLVSGSYPLINYTPGLLMSSSSSLSLAPGAVSLHQSGSFNYSTPGVVTLDITGNAFNLVWVGGSGNIWDRDNATNLVWYDGTGSNAFGDGDRVTFDATAGTANLSVSLSGTLAPAAVTVTGSNGYTFTGPGRLSGVGGLAVAGSGNLTIANTGNNYLGATAIQSGQLHLGANNALPTAGSLVLGTTAGSGTFDLAGYSQQIGSLGVGPGATPGDQVIGSSAASGTALLTVNGTGASLFGGQIVDTLPGGGGKVALAVGGGVLTLTGSNSYSGGTTISGGTLQLASPTAITGTATNMSVNGLLDLAGNSFGFGRLAGSGTITSSVTGAMTLTVGNNDQASAFTGSIRNDSGTLALVKSGSATLTLAGSNGYSGGTTLNAGLLNINHNNALGSGPFTISGGTIDSTVAGVTLAGNAQNWNADVIFLGTQSLNLGTGTVAMSGSRTVSVGAGTLTVGGAISGSGSLTKTGSGTLALNALNIYTGGTTVSGGTVLLGHNSALGATSGSVAVSGGVLDLGGKSPSVGTVTLASGSIINSGTSATLTGTSYLVQSGTISAVLAGGAASLNKSTTGLVTLSAANTYAGGTTINGGTIQVGNAGAFGTGAITINTSGTPITGSAFNLQAANRPDIPTATDLVVNATATLSNNITIVGGDGTHGLSIGGSGNLTYTGIVGYTGMCGLSSSVTLTLGPGGAINLGNAGNSVLFMTGASALVLGGGSLTVQGWNANNCAYLNNVTMNSGWASLGTTAGTSTSWYPSLNSNAVLTLNGGTLAVQGFSGNTTNTIYFNGGTLRAIQSAGTNVFLPAAAIVSKIQANGAVIDTNSLAPTIAGILQHDPALGTTADGGLLKLGAGTLTLSATNTYTGPTTLKAGVLAVSHNLNLGSGTAATATIVFDGGTLRTLAGITSSRNVTLNSTGVFDANGFYSSLAGTVSGTGSLTMTGTAANSTLDLSGSNNFTGNLAIQSGIVAADNASALTAANTVSFPGGTGTLQIVGVPVTIGGLTSATGTPVVQSFDSSATLTVQNSADNTFSGTLVNGSTSAVLSLTKAGTAVLTLTGTSAYTGATTVNGGTLRYGIANTLPAGTAVQINNGAQLDLGAFSGTVGSVTLANGSIVGSGSATLTGTSFNVQNGSVTAHLAGGGGLTKTTSGTVTLGNTSAYLGLTDVQAGVLSLGINQAVPGDLQVSGGTLALAGHVNTVGTATLTDGTISGGTLGAAYYDVRNGLISANLTNDAGPGTAMLKSTTGAVTLSGSNNYSAGTTVNAGTLNIASADSLPTGRNLSLGSGGHVVLASGLAHAISLGGLTISSGVGSDAIGAGLPTPPASAAWSGDRAPTAPGQAGSLSNESSAAPTPEPGTIALLVAAAAFCSAAFRRSRRPTRRDVCAAYFLALFTKLGLRLLVPGLALVLSLASGVGDAGVIDAVDVTSCDDTQNLGASYAVGWDFTVSQTITVESLGQFDPDSAPVTNQVAIYQQGGAQLVLATVANTLPEVMSGSFNARYLDITKLVLAPGNYVIMSTQSGERFMAPGGSPTATFGTGIAWNKGVALANGSGYGPLPTTAPAGWPIENGSAYRYIGPTFRYELGNTTLGSIWISTSSTDWGTAGNWDNGSVPDSQGAMATLGATTGGTGSVDLGTKGRTLGMLTFSNKVGTTITSTSYNLTLDNAANPAYLTVAGSHSISAGVTLNTDAAITVTSSSDSLTLGGVITGTGKGLAMSGSGLLVLANTNNGYSGGTTLGGGTVRFATVNSLGGGNITFGGGTIQYPTGYNVDVSGKFNAVASGKQAGIDTNNNTVAFATAISGSGGLAKIGGGALILTTNNTYTGPTTISGGTLQVGNGTTDGSIQNSSNITNNGVLTYNLVGTSSYSGVISGSGSLVKMGPGTQVLSGGHTYSGPTIITGGSLKLNIQGSMAPSGAAVAYTFDTDTSGGPVTNSGSLGSTKNATINSTAGGSITSGGHYGQCLTMTDASGHLRPIGTIDLSSATTTGWTASIWYKNLIDGGDWHTLYHSTTDDYQTIINQPTRHLNSLWGGTQDTGYTMPAGDTGWHMITTVGNVSGTTQFYIDGVAVGSPATNRSSSNILSIGARDDSAQQFAGQLDDFYFYPRALSAADVAALYSAGSGPGYVLPMTTPVQLGSNGTLDLGGGTQTIGSLSNYSGSGGTVALGAGGRLTVGGGDSTTFSGVITGSGGSLVRAGTGTLTLNGVSLYSGPTTVQGGKLIVNSPGSLSSSVTITAGTAGTGTLGGNGTVAGITVQSGGHLSPGVAVPGGTLHAGSLALNAGSILDFKFGTGNDQIALTGNLTIDGGGLDLYQADGVTRFDSLGNYQLLSYGGSLGGTGALSVLNRNLARRYSFDTSGGTVTLHIAGTPVWNAGAGPGDTGWNNAANWSGVAPQAGDLLTFTASGGGVSNNNIPGPRSYVSLQFEPGAGSLTLTGSGVTLTGDESNNVILNNSSGTQTVSLPITVQGTGRQINAASGPVVVSNVIDNGGNALTVTGSQSTTVSGGGTVTGSGGLTKAGAGALYLNTANTYTGNTRIGQGTLSVGHSAALSTTIVDMNAADSGTLNFSIPAATLGGLTGSRNLTVNNVILSVGAKNVDTTYSGNLSGSMGLTKVGNAALVLAGSNSYSGPTVINAGTLRLSGQQASSGAINLLPMGDSITQQGYYIAPLTATLSSNGYTPNVLANEGHSGYNIAYQWTYNGTAYTGTRSGILDSISSFMNHPGVNATNSYVLLMIGTNDVDTNCYLDDGNVQNRLGQLISAITGIAPQAHVVVAQIVPNLGSIAKDTAVKQFNTDVAAAVATATGNVSLVDMYDAFHPSLYTPYTGTANPYMGDTLHPNTSGGTAMAQVWYDAIAATLGTSGGGNAIPDTSAVTIAVSGTLDLAGGQETIGPLSGAGNVTLGSSSAARLTVNSTTGNDTTFSGVISGAGGLWKTGPAALTLSGTNTFTGDTRVPLGTLKIGTPLALQSSTLDMNAADAGSFDMNGNDATLGGLNGARGITLATGKTLSIGNNSQNTAYSGALTGSGGLAKIGAGTSALVGANTYNGPTTIARGALNVGGGGLSAGSNLVFNASSGALPVLEQSGTFSRTAGTAAGQVQWVTSGGFAAQGGPLAVQLGGGTAQVAWTATFGNGNSLVLGSATADNVVDLQNSLDLGGGSRTVNVQDNTNSTTDLAKISGVISGSGSLTKTGAGRLNLAGNNTFTGGATINAGTLQLGHTGALNAATPNAVAFTPNTAGKLQLNGNSVTISGLTTDAGSPGAAVVENANATAAVLTVNKASGTDIFAGVLQDGTGGGSLGLTKTGLGTLALTGANTFTGPTTVTGGTLSGNVASLPGNIAVGSGANVTFNQTTNATYAKSLSGSGSVTKTGSGILTISGSNTYTGGTNINVGTFKLGPSFGGQVMIPMTGWNQDLIAEKTAASPQAGTTSNVASWVWYEQGAPGSSQGLPSSGLITSLYGSNVQFQLQPYTATNNCQVDNGTLTLTTPGKFQSLQFLNSAQGGGGSDWNATLNFADGSSTALASIHDPDWTQNGQNAMTTVGLVGRNASWTGFYTGTLNIFEHDFTLSASDQAKTLNSITLARTGGGPLMFFALSGAALGSPNTNYLADTSPVSIAGGATLDLGGDNETIGPLSGAPGSSVTLGGGTLTVNGNGVDSTFSGMISGSGGLTKIGAGTQVLAGSNTYTGTTNVNAGTLLATKPGSLPGYATPSVTVSAGATLAVTAGTAGSEWRPDDIYNLTHGAAFSAGAKIGLQVTGTNTFPQDAADLTGSQTAKGLVKLGGGTLALSGTGAYVGGTTVNEGTLRVSGADALTTGGNLTIASGGHVVLAGGLSHAISLGGLTITSGVGTPFGAGSSFGAGLPTPPASGASSGYPTPDVPLAAYSAAAPTPEPGTLVLLIAAALAGLARRRRKSLKLAGCLQ